MTSAGRTSDRSKRGIRIFRASEAVDLSETDFMAPTDRSQIPLEAQERIGTANRAGSKVQVFVRQPGGFSFVHCWFKANYLLPRHSHNADCMYYVISGSLKMGNVGLRPGDSFFVPADAPYQYNVGPDGVEILEVRYGTERFEVTMAEKPGRWDAIADVIEANHDSWAAMDVSPTLEANAG